MKRILCSPLFAVAVVCAGFALVVTSAVLTTSATVRAQGTTPVINPTRAIFTASPDHDSGVDSYTLEIFDGGNVARTDNIGKPTPVNGDIAVPLTRAGLQPNKTYVFHVTANGPFGSARSASPSGPFVFPGAPGAPSNLRVQ